MTIAGFGTKAHAALHRPPESRRECPHAGVMPVTAAWRQVPDTGGMDEFRELVLVWTIALTLMVTGVAVAHYSTEEPHLPVAGGAKP